MSVHLNLWMICVLIMHLRHYNKEVVDAMIEAMTRALAKGDKIEIRGFGNFKVRQRGARKARNPRTGKMVEVPAKQVPYFKPGKELKALVEGD